MGGKVIQFPGSRAWNLRKIEEIIESKLIHDDPAVLLAMKEELKHLVAKYYDDREFEVVLPLPPGLSPEQFHEIEESFQRVFLEQNERLVKRAQDIFLDLCLARLQVCELRVRLRAGEGQDPEPSAK
ncbi:hypothetical protein DESUT3_16130 [Desulfuromonas versatilis]|uniref:Uncharacterized protein n=1 Tax=Desulfuromonas versatilis TaxID=2802975 RepID=A0ABN6DXE2_9BACT|nr:hypothetical protein [Desulfuromonas versatilis]BCR04544.1 hypothetical protein DESUT3_16130 [Desulfuromonas versatilis]